MTENRALVAEQQRVSMNLLALAVQFGDRQHFLSRANGAASIRQELIDAHQLIRRLALVAQPSEAPVGEAVEREGFLLRYAQDLATVAAKKVGCVPEWRPLDDLGGVLTQIDNCLTGLVAASVAPTGFVMAPKGRGWLTGEVVRRAFDIFMHDAEFPGSASAMRQAIAYALDQRAASSPDNTGGDIYSADQRRVADYLVGCTGIGAGMDPIGFVMASHAVLMERSKALHVLTDVAETYMSVGDERLLNAVNQARTSLYRELLHSPSVEGPTHPQPTGEGEG